MATVRLVGVTKRFGDLVAIHEVGIEIRDGEFMVFLGPSGGGKTTTMRCVAGLEVHDEGDIFIDDILVN
ncbi:MAG: ATP-binding cassette domain-containing protein, partial [Chloroflexi bacterium]|nr:ATP-binding cassette domain-containing protein [Chloroflexota bacterium]